MQRFERGWPGLIYRAQLLMLGMTEDSVVRMMQMDILCSVVHPANLVMNNKILVIFPISGSMWWNLTLTFFPFLLHDGIHAGVREVQKKGSDGGYFLGMNNMVDVRASCTEVVAPAWWRRGMRQRFHKASLAAFLTNHHGYNARSQNLKFIFLIYKNV